MHFSPIQELGVSGKTDCIQDQLKLNPELFHSSFDSTEIEQIVKSLESEQSALSFIDIILEYTCQTSKWLTEVPAAVYNAKTAPSLASAVALDEALAELSLQFEQAGKENNNNKKDFHYQKNNVIECMDDVVAVMDIVKTNVI